MSLKSARREMWNNDPRCHWCGRLTVLPVSGQSVSHAHTATIDHVYSKWHHLQGTAPLNASSILVLACGQCNHDRAIIAQTLYLLVKRKFTAHTFQTARLVKLAEAFPPEYRQPPKTEPEPNPLDVITTGRSGVRERYDFRSPMWFPPIKYLRTYPE